MIDYCFVDLMIDKINDTTFSSTNFPPLISDNPKSTYYSPAHNLFTLDNDDLILDY